MTSEERRRQRWQRLRKVSDADLPALTIRRARVFLRHYPDFGPAYITLGVALVEIARYEEAIEAFERAMSHCPESKRHLPWYQMGHLFAARGDYPQAESWYRRAI